MDLGFKYDNIVMEESAQILEIETFVPMVLQNFDEVEGCRLKRVVLIGDHHQLPPVVKNVAFQKYGHLDQSLFARCGNFPTINSLHCFADTPDYGSSLQIHSVGCSHHSAGRSGPLTAEHQYIIQLAL